MSEEKNGGPVEAIKYKVDKRHAQELNHLRKLTLEMWNHLVAKREEYYQSIKALPDLNLIIQAKIDAINEKLRHATDPKKIEALERELRNKMTWFEKTEEKKRGNLMRDYSRETYYYGQLAEERKNRPEWAIVESSYVNFICQRYKDGITSYNALINNSYSKHSNGKRGGNRKAKRPNEKSFWEWTSFGCKQTRLLQKHFVGGEYGCNNKTAYVVIPSSRETGQKAWKTAIRYKVHEELPENAMRRSYLFKVEANGDWFLYVTFAGQRERKKVKITGESVGIDFGMKTFITSSDGEELDGYKEISKHIYCIVKHSQAMARRYKKIPEGDKNEQSKGYYKAKDARKLAFQKLTDARKILHYTIANQIVAKYDFIYIEDLSMRGMQRLWGKKISRIAWSNFVKILERVCLRDGKELYKIGKYQKSTKACSCCGHEVDQKFFLNLYQESCKKENTVVPLHRSNKVATLSVRNWTCPSCGTYHDRDINAAKVILKKGEEIRLMGQPMGIAELNPMAI